MENLDDKEVINLPEIVGGGYSEFWKFRGRYRVVKGGRGSKKSKTTALWYIVNLVKYEQANLLVVRKTYKTLKDSCFMELKWAIKKLNMGKYFKVKETSLEIEYIPTGQKIYFRGLDDPLKVTSMTVDKGYLCWLWVEEAYEILQEEDFNILDESIRGEVSEGLFKQITITFNPWNDRHWLKGRFFDCEADEDIMAITTTYRCNEWLDKSDLKVFENMKINNPKRYRVAGLGEWGVVDGVIFENWKEEEFDLESIRKIAGIRSVFGLDFGYTNDPSAFFCGLVDIKGKRIYVFDELYETGLQNEVIYKKISSMGYSRERIIADSSEPKSIDRLRDLGLRGIRGARKGKDSVMNGIDFIQGFRIIVLPKCVNFIKEISNYVWEVDRFGKTLNSPTDNFNHLMDSMRYAMESVVVGEAFSFD